MNDCPVVSVPDNEVVEIVTFLVMGGPEDTEQEPTAAVSVVMVPSGCSNVKLNVEPA